MSTETGGLAEPDGRPSAQIFGKVSAAKRYPNVFRELLVSQGDQEPPPLGTAVQRKTSEIFEGFESDSEPDQAIEGGEGGDWC